VSSSFSQQVDTYHSIAGGVCLYIGSYKLSLV
jgi:hypothetical protein